MSKQLDARNAKLRAKAKDQPYYKWVRDTRIACPYCDSILSNHPEKFAVAVCDCGEWHYDWHAEGSRYKYVATKPEEN